MLDVDENGEALALTDSILFVHYLFGLRGEPFLSQSNRLFAKNTIFDSNAIL